MGNPAAKFVKQESEIGRKKYSSNIEV